MEKVKSKFQRLQDEESKMIREISLLGKRSKNTSQEVNGLLLGKSTDKSVDKLNHLGDDWIDMLEAIERKRKILMKDIEKREKVLVYDRKFLRKKRENVA